MADRGFESWDDLRLALAVARAGSLSGAARRLGVNHTTVSRRLAAFESQLGVRLFDRRPEGLSPTETGESVVDAATRMESEIERASRSVLGRDGRLSGSVRVAVADVWGVWLMPVFADFARAYPGIELEIVAGNQPTNLTRREADVAIRVSDRPPEHLVGRRVVRIASAVYAAGAYLEQHPAPPLRGHRWIGWDEALGVRDFEAWLHGVDPEARITCRVNSGEMMLRALAAGLGVARSICPAADDLPGVVRLTEPTPGRPLWLLTHPDLRRTARIRAFLDFAAERIAGLRGRIEAQGADGACADETGSGTVTP